jgi:hypothetical protein
LRLSPEMGGCVRDRAPCATVCCGECPRHEDGNGAWRHFRWDAEEESENASARGPAGQQPYLLDRRCSSESFWFDLDICSRGNGGGRNVQCRRFEPHHPVTHEMEQRVDCQQNEERKRLRLGVGWVVGGATGRIVRHTAIGRARGRAEERGRARVG